MSLDRVHKLKWEWPHSHTAPQPSGGLHRIFSPKNKGQDSKLINGHVSIHHTIFKYDISLKK
uniref:Uncharacterized protein n=1 Tax=Anguilla anguilla TaxID=7936 RepID=A0A0E9QM25_ANGAN